MIKVGFDISQTAHRGGVAVYTTKLAYYLQKNPNLDMRFFYSSLRKPYTGDLKNVRKFILPPTIFEFMFNDLRMPTIETFLGDIDIFHSSDWTQPPSKAKKVTTYHDVIPLKYPEWSMDKIVSVQKRRLQIVENEIDMVIADSIATKNDLLEISKIPDYKITVIYPGVDEIFKPQDRAKVEKFIEDYDLPERFILVVGGVGERKNLKRIINASEGYEVVILGDHPEYGVKFLKDLEREELPLLYSAASVLVYASLYEGFGFPILEALRCGCPVVTSNVSSMPEVGGDAVLYVDPRSVVDIKENIHRLLNNHKLKEELVKKGVKQAEKFSWDKCALETTKMYEDLYGQ